MMGRGGPKSADRSANSNHGSPIDFYPFGFRVRAGSQTCPLPVPRDSSSRHIRWRTMLQIVSNPIIRGFRRASEYSQTSGCGLYLEPAGKLMAGAGRTGLLALCLLVVGTISISGCAGLAGAANPSGQPNQPPPGTAAAISVSPPSINFGSVAVGSTVSQSITISNTGGSNLIVTQESITAQGFTLTSVSLPMTIGAGKQSTINLLFSPTATGIASGVVSVMSNAANSPATVTVSGMGISTTSLLNANSSSLTFGNVPLGSSSVLGITITNAGNSHVSISQVSSSVAGFTTSGVSAGMILAPGQSATLDVAFAPAAAGNLTGVITIASDATNSPTIISLSGSGVNASSHSVTLNWTASTTAVVGYNVYRSTVSGGPYAQLNSSLVLPTSYTDSTVHLSQIYYYVVTSVATGAESVDSNEASAAIPAS